MARHDSPGASGESWPLQNWIAAKLTKIFATDDSRWEPLLIVTAPVRPCTIDIAQRFKK